MATADASPSYPESPILVVDDDETLRTRIELLFARAGLDNVVATDDQGLASAMVAEGRAGLVLLDLFLPEEVGETLLREFSIAAPEVPVIVLTSSADTATVVRCMKAGAVDYLIKPIDETRLFISVWNALASIELRAEARGFRDRVLAGKLERPEAFARIITSDERVLALFKYVESVARSRQPVLITGETGTGKELFARAVHEASDRKGPFLAVNVGGLDDTMFSDSLFGHRKGAYTGADTQRAGLLKEAMGGTILLDEIGDLETHSQIKLLRLLQEGEYYPLGADSPLRSDARVVAATTKDLKSAAAAGAFRSDLFYRLQTHPIAIPPLRERPGDLPLLARRFLDYSARDLGTPFRDESALKACADGVASALEEYSFPGNVRELQSLLHDAVAEARGGELDLDGIRGRIGLEPRGKTQKGRDQSKATVPASSPSVEGAGLPPLAQSLAEGRIPTLQEAERELVRMAVASASGNLSQAASILGISRQTLYNKLKD
jgi:DNA-binding NtrC family response regulator